VGAAAATIMRAPFVLGDPEELRAVIAGAGFRDVDVRSATGTVRFDSAAHFLRTQVAGSPLAGPVGEASDDAREALARQVTVAMRPYEIDDRLAFPIGALIATGYA
jgi:hypothetical protein